MSRHGDDETDDTDALRNDDVEITFVRLVGVSRDEEGAADGQRSLSATKIIGKWLRGGRNVHGSESEGRSAKEKGELLRIAEGRSELREELVE